MRWQDLINAEAAVESALRASQDENARLSQALDCVRKVGADAACSIQADLHSQSERVQQLLTDTQPELPTGW